MKIIPGSLYYHQQNMSLKIVCCYFTNMQMMVAWGLLPKNGDLDLLLNDA